MRYSWIPALVLFLVAPREEGLGFNVAVKNAENSLEQKDLKAAREWIFRALERDAKSTVAWDLRARLAEAEGDRDEEIYSLHREYRFLIAQKAPKATSDALRAKLTALDPVAKDLLELSKTFIAKFAPIAEQYEKEKRPHSAIRVHKQMLALDPELETSRAAIEKLASAPDPSLAEDAKPKDLLADVSKQWIKEHDAAHNTWDTKSELVRANYTTKTDAGYECMVRAGEAMEQMNAFYRVFFHYGTPDDKKTVPRIELRIFKNRDEYLSLGSNPPKWSGGIFIGDAVETYVGQGGFQEMIGTLFHESAHQFVSLGTNAAGWLNEGLASFFEGCRILQNGTVLMNEPADHRLFPLVDRMKNGWMSNATDGFDPSNPDSEPKTAPSFRIVLEDEYGWGPPWYAPTWGVVFFLYNYQDPADGRYVYRDSFREFVDASGGKSGKAAITTFEKVVLGKPKPPIKGFKRPDGSKDMALPKTVDELNEVWKNWMVQLSEERSGKLEVKRPWLQWARCAVLDKDPKTAQEHFEKGLVANPTDVATLVEFAQFLAEQKNTDRATKLMLAAVRVLESAEKPDQKSIDVCDRLLDKWDGKRQSLERVHKELVAASKSIVARYEAEKLPMMVMDVSWRLATQHEIPELFESYRTALESSRRSLQLWELAYNEKDLSGWAAVGDSGFKADGQVLQAKFGEYAADKFDFQILTLDRVTSGDFSMEAEVQVDRGKVNFCGLVFGRKGSSNFHALILFPGVDKNDGTAGSGFVDLASSYGSGSFKTWRHSPVETKLEAGVSTTGVWHRLRVDISGTSVDTWFDGEFLSTQEFGSLDVVRGNFGLIIGPGEARYRNVRFMARDGRDPASKIERDVRILALRELGKPINGSYLGMIPPFPTVQKWAQKARKSWTDVGPVPQLLVLWSVAQNEIIPIDGWLREFAEKTKDLDLQIVSIASPNDAEAIDEYLKSHTFPGSVGVDSRPVGTFGTGDTNQAYFTTRFNLPRLVLLDIDRTVVWEGDPGFVSNQRWKPGDESFIDTPFAELVEKRKLKQFEKWIADWPRVQAALHDGELAANAQALKDALLYDPKAVPEVADARQKFAQLVSSGEAFDATAASIVRDECDPAISVLADWMKLAGKAPDKKQQLALKGLLDSKVAKAWASIPVAIENYRKKSKKEPDPALAPDLAAKIDALPGRFPRELAADLKSALAKGDSVAFEKLLDEHARRPTLWFAREFLHW